MKNSEQPLRPRKFVYRPTSNKGIRLVWEWCPKKMDYTQRRGGKKYLATVYYSEKTFSESFESIEQAKNWRIIHKHKLESGNYSSGEIFGIVFEKFIQQKISEGLQVTTLESYRQLSKHFEFFRHQNVQDLRSKNIDDWIRHLKSPVYLRSARLRSSRFSFTHELSLLRGVFSYYGEYCDEAFVNPVKKRHFRDAIINHAKVQAGREERKTKFIPEQQIDEFISSLKALATEKPQKLIYLTAALVQLRSGMRIGEVCALEWSDINWTTGNLVIHKTVQWQKTKDRPSQISMRTKNGRNRPMRLIPEVLQALKDLQEFLKRTSGLIFSEDGKEIVSYRSVQHHYDSALKLSGLKFRSTHILRHTFATQFLNSTGNKLALTAVLGHSDPRQTDRYGKITESTVHDGLDDFGARLIKPKPEET